MCEFGDIVNIQGFKPFTNIKTNKKAKSKREQWKLNPHLT